VNCEQLKQLATSTTHGDAYRESPSAGNRRCYSQAVNFGELPAAAGCDGPCSTGRGGTGTDHVRQRRPGRRGQQGRQQGQQHRRGTARPHSHPRQERSTGASVNGTRVNCFIGSYVPDGGKTVGAGTPIPFTFDEDPVNRCDTRMYRMPCVFRRQERSFTATIGTRAGTRRSGGQGPATGTWICEMRRGRAATPRVGASTTVPRRGRRGGVELFRYDDRTCQQPQRVEHALERLAGRQCRIAWVRPSSFVPPVESPRDLPAVGQGRLQVIRSRRQPPAGLVVPRDVSSVVAPVGQLSSEADVSYPSLHQVYWCIRVLAIAPRGNE
jgi:hypothetical protein